MYKDTVIDFTIMLRQELQTYDQEETLTIAQFVSILERIERHVRNLPERG